MIVLWNNRRYLPPWNAFRGSFSKNQAGSRAVLFCILVSQFHPFPINMGTIPDFITKRRKSQEFGNRFQISMTSLKDSCLYLIFNFFWIYERKSTIKEKIPRIHFRDFIQCRDTESNCGHYNFQSYALPTELSRQTIVSQQRVIFYKGFCFVSSNSEKLWQFRLQVSGVGCQTRTAVTLSACCRLMHSIISNMLRKRWFTQFES